jgi:fructokinase
VSRTEIVCGGEVLWDFFEERAGTYRRTTGGASANAAIALARLGVPVALAGAVGDDALGEALVAAIAAEGVDVRAVAVRKAPTGIVLKTNGRFSPYRSDAPVDASGVRARWSLVGSMLPVVTGLVAPLRAVDLNVRPRLWPSAARMRAAALALVKGAALVKASDHDLERLWGSEQAGLATLARAAPGAVLVVTRAAGLASALGPWGKVELPARKVRAAESTGAGDAFMAGVVAVVSRAGARWRAPEVLTRALDLGHRLGAKAASRTGASTGLVNLEKIPWRTP